MNKVKLLVTFLLLFTAIAFAQQKKFVSYEVKKGETIKSIAKGINLSTKDLLKLNPGVGRKPVLGTVIIIPNKNYGKPIETTVINEGVKPVEKNIELYVVKPKETLYGISKKFGVTEEAIKEANPQLTDGLKIGMQLSIPEPENLEEAFELHTVVKDDTVYNLTKRYNVTEADLMTLNPALKDGLKLGMILKIKPLKSDGIEGEDIIAAFEEHLNFDRTYNVAVILPYKLNTLVDSIIDESFSKSNNLLNIVTDFHLGTKMAIDSLKSKGLKINVEYFDSEKSNQKLQILANKNSSFNTTDLTIGPLFFENAKWLSRKTNTSIIAPIYSKKQDAVNHKNLIKSAPNNLVLQEKLLAYLEENYKGENVLVVNDGKAETQTQLWQIVNKIKSFDSVQKVEVIKPEKGYINRAIFSKKIDTLASTWVLLISDDKVTASTTVNSLKGFPTETKIDLFALNKGKNFDNIDNIFLGKMNFTFPTAEFIDPADENVNIFYNSYYDKYNAYPSKYAIRGFDVTYDALVRLASNENLEEGLDAGKSIRVFSTFNYSKNNFGSYENHGVFIIRYSEDLSATIIE